jgi:hypothetical protein
MIETITPVTPVSMPHNTADRLRYTITLTSLSFLHLIGSRRSGKDNRHFDRHGSHASPPHRSD